jgi:hypothetical protein
MSTLRLAIPLAAALGLATPAQAQSSMQASLAPAQSYAIEVAPGTYVIHRPAAGRGYPYVGCGRDCAPVPAERPMRRARTHSDPVLIEELRRKHVKKRDGKVINTTRVVREKPIVIERRRIVDDPPRVIERVRYEDGTPARRDDLQTHAPRGPRKSAERRVIHAEAEVTILGPDRMSIRLFRKQNNRTATAEAE